MAIRKDKYSPSTLIEETDTLTDTPVEIEYEDGSIEFDFDDFVEEEKVTPGDEDLEETFDDNLVDLFEEQELQKIATDVIARFEEDKTSRSEWLKTVADGLSLLGTKLEETSDPFPGACAAHHPLILESAVKFQAKAAAELYPSKGPVKTAILGKQTPEKDAQANRVKEHMNYQVMYQMEEYFDEMESMLFYLPIVGSAFKRIYYDVISKRPCSEFINVESLVTNYYTKNLKTAPCFTYVEQVTHNELMRLIDAGSYRDDLDFSKPGQPDEENLITTAEDSLMGYSEPNEETVHVLLHQYVFLNLPESSGYHNENGVADPYVITVDQETMRVLSIRRNWKFEDDKRERQLNFVHYRFVPGMGFYGLGYVHLLGNLQMTLTGALRSLVDAGAFANLQAGFVDKRLRWRGESGPLGPGQFKEVEAGGIDLDKAIKLIPFKEPSQTLLTMYQMIESRSQKFADSTEQVIADSTNYGPVGTTLALLEASTKFFSGIHKRLHQAQKQEFKILAEINYATLDETQEFDTYLNTFEIRKEDYDGRIDVEPVSDPNLSSQSQRLTLAEAIKTGALQNPQIHNMEEVYIYQYRAMGLDEAQIQRIMVQKQEAQPNDPITDIQLAQQGKPIKAFPDQDHQAHIAIKSAFLGDPRSGANPAMQNIAPVIQANIQEHMVLEFVQNVQGQQQVDPASANPVLAAQKVSQQNQKMAEIEAQGGPDSAKEKLADAELLKAMNESKRVANEAIVDQAELTLKAMQLQIEQLKEDNKMVIAGLQNDMAKYQTEIKLYGDMLKQLVTQTSKANEKTAAQEVDKKK